MDIRLLLFYQKITEKAVEGSIRRLKLSACV